MAIKDILVQVDGGKSAPARYAAAIELARTHSAHLTGLCLAIEPAVPATILGMVPPEAIATQREAVREQGETAIAQFRLAVERAGISGEGRIVQVRDFDAVDVFIQHGRHSDLVILGQWDPVDFLPVAQSFPADVLMGCGRPGIVIPLSARRRHSASTCWWRGTVDAKRRAPSTTPCRCWSVPTPSPSSPSIRTCRATISAIRALISRCIWHATASR